MKDLSVGDSAIQAPEGVAPIAFHKAFLSHAPSKKCRCFRCYHATLSLKKLKIYEVYIQYTFLFSPWVRLDELTTPLASECRNPFLLAFMSRGEGMAISPRGRQPDFQRKQPTGTLGALRTGRGRVDYDEPERLPETVSAP